MPDQVERFKYSAAPGTSQATVLRTHSEGHWVRHTDYVTEQLERKDAEDRADKAEDVYTELCHELARLLGPIKPRMDLPTNAQLIAKVRDTLEDSDG